MAIRLLNAMVVQNAEVRDDGTIQLVRPILSIDLSAEQRAGFEASGKPRGLIPLPPYDLVLLLWGGTPGQKITITGGFGPAGEKAGTAVMQKDFTWKDSPGFTLKLNLAGEVNFTKSAVYELRLIANGEPLGIVPLVIRWDDETEF